MIKQNSCVIIVKLPGDLKKHIKRQDVSTEKGNEGTKRTMESVWTKKKRLHFLRLFRKKTTYSFDVANQKFCKVNVEFIY